MEMQPRCPIILVVVLLCTLAAMTCGELVDKCCPTGEAMALDGSCVKRGVDGPWLETLPPPTFSAATDGFISVPLRASGVGKEPQCKEGSAKREVVLEGSGAEEWLLLVGTGADKAELYITGDEETLLDFCLEEIQSDGDNIVGTVARFCSATEEKEADEKKDGEAQEEADCSTVLCVSVCCPPGTIVKRNSNECEAIPAALGNYVFEPPFVDKKQNPVTIEDRNNYKIVHGEPQCETILNYDGPTNRFVFSSCFIFKLLCRSSRDSEFSLQDDGLLHIGRHTLTYLQYCLQVYFDDTFSSI